MKIYNFYTVESSAIGILKDAGVLQLSKQT